ncbi:MAG: FUSC family protein, partial [Pseudomonadota bacterium]
MLMSASINQEYLKYAIKGGLAALLALVSAYFLDIQQSYWVLFGAMTVTKLHVGASFHRGKQRIYGTLLGVIISVLLALYLLHWPLGIALIMPICIFGAVYYFPYYSVCVVFITILFVLTFGVASHHPIHYGVARILDTALGVAIAVIISLYVWPNRMSQVLEREFQTYISQVTQLFTKFTHAFLSETLLLEEKNTDLKMLENTLSKLKEEMTLIEHEPGKKAN